MGIANCNKRTYPGSQISKMFTLGPDKTRYTTSHGITPNFYEILKANVNLADFYFISIDESMNSITPINQMDFLIRYWDSEANLVRVRFWNSSYLGQGTHKDVLEKSENSPTGLNPSKMIQVSMDGPSFNLKFLESLCNLRESEGIPGLIDIGVCQLHTMHGAFEIGAVKSAWNIYKILKAVRQIFHDRYVIFAVRQIFQSEEMIIFPLQVQHHSLIISVLQDGLKVKVLPKEQSHYGNMCLKL